MHPEPCFRVYFHGFFKNNLRVKIFIYFLIVRNVVNNSPAISFGARALVRDVKDKKPSKIMIFRARTTHPGLAGPAGGAARAEIPNLLTSHSAGSDRQKLGAHQKTLRISKV